MASLEEIKSGAIVQGVVPVQPVEVVTVEWIGEQAINLVYRIQGGGVAETTLYRDDESRLQLDARGRTWSFDADGDLLRLVTEANRIKLARNRLIARLDVLARNEELQEKLSQSTEWDLIICDEAHRMSATYFGGEVEVHEALPARTAAWRGLPPSAADVSDAA